jgi:tetratricopeptide (TPR) repeat protein
MTAAWKVSVTALRERLPQALDLLRCCAFFGPEPIPRNVFRRAAQPTGSAVAEVISNPILMATVIRELGRYALVTLDGGSVKVHRLIQALLRDELTEEQRAAYRRAAHLILTAAAPENPDDAMSWPRFRELLPHVNAEFTELPKSDDQAVRDLARKAMRYLYQLGDYQSALTLTERFIEQWTKDSGPNSPDVLAAQRHLGNILRNLGRYPESYRVTEEALAASRRELGEDNHTTLSLRNSFGADLRAFGGFREALELDRESLSLFGAAYQPSDSRSLRLQSSVALDYGLTSNYSTARDLYERAVTGMSTNPESTAIDVLGAWIGLSWTLRLLGQFKEAFDVGQDALDYGQDPQQGLGPDHLATIRSITAYTVVSRKLPDRRTEALELGKTTLDLASRLFGDDHPDTLAIAVSVSNLLRTISDDLNGEALELAESTMARYPGVYGADHPYNYGCMSNLALLKRVTGDPVAARALDEEALRGLTAALGPDHHFTLSVAMNLASDSAVLGLRQDARRIGEDTWSRLSALLGADHPHTLGCAGNLALDLMAAGDDDAGNSLQTQTLDCYRQTQDPDFPDAAVVAAGGRLDPDFDPPPI